MLRLTLIGCLAAVVVAVAPASTQSAARPGLRFVDNDPLAVQGVRFDPNATVRVRVLTFTRTWTKTVAVTARGTFVARFAGVEVGRCGTWARVTATSSSGERASVGLPHFECPTRR